MTTSIYVQALLDMNKSGPFYDVALLWIRDEKGRRSKWSAYNRVTYGARDLPQMELREYPSRQVVDDKTKADL